MARTQITAKGQINGREVTILCGMWKGRIRALYNGQENTAREALFYATLKEGHAIGGTYYPPVNSMLNALEVLKNWTFDSPPEIRVQGEIEEIPYEPGVIY